MKEIEQGISKDIGEEIYMAAQRLHRLIENLLSMSRLDSGRLSPRFDWYDVHDLVNSVTGLLKNELKEYDLSINIPDDMPLVRIDFGLIEQVLYNLLVVQFIIQYHSICPVSYIDRIRFPARRNKFLHIYYRLRERICRQRFTLHLQQILPG